MGPNWGTDPTKAEKSLDDEGYRVRTRGMEQDLSLNEVSKISFDHQRQRKLKRPKENVTEGRMGVKEEVVHEQSSGIYTVANRTLINKVLYTNEDAPPTVLIHVPPSA